MIYDRIKRLCALNGLTVTGLEKELGFSRGSLVKIDKNRPSSERLQKIADRLGVSAHYLLTGEDDEPRPYYLNEGTRELVQFLFDNPEYKVLFDATRKIKREDIDFVRELLERASR